MSRRLNIRRLGFVEYADGLALQAAFHQARVRDLVPDTLFLLQHFPVLTLGRKGRGEDILVDREALRARGVQVFETDRGGEATYHGPGQIVGYPIVDLSPDRRDVRRYVRELEETMLAAAASVGVRAGRVGGLNGIWLAADAEPPSAGPARKLGAVGVHLSRWVSSHGFALNVNTDLSAFEWIVACGIRDRGVSSLAKEVGHTLDLEAAEDALAARFAALFDAEAHETPAERHTIQVQVVRSSPRGPELLALRRSAARGGYWQPITGRPEGDETSLATAQRELLEETGLQSPVRALDYQHAILWPGTAKVPEVPEVCVETAFVARADAASTVRLSDEHEAYAWVTLAEALERFPFAGLRRGAQLAAGGLSAASLRAQAVAP